ncbi:MAG: hypothetical protein ABH823_03805 [bacterium]
MSDILPYQLAALAQWFDSFESASVVFVECGVGVGVIDRAASIATIDGTFLTDAQKLDDLGAIGIAKDCFEAGRESLLLDGLMLLLREQFEISQQVKSATAKKLARQRIAYLIDFLDQHQLEMLGEI